MDIDDTIYDYQSAHRLAIASVYTKIHDVIENVDEDTFQRSYRAERTRITEKHAGTGASRSRFLALQAVFEAMAVPNAYFHAKVAEDHYWHVLVANMTPNAPLIDTLKQFSALGRPICAVTDMQVRIQVEKIIILGLQTEITHMVSSEEVGVEKPDGIMFKTAISPDYSPDVLEQRFLCAETVSHLPRQTGLLRGLSGACV